MHVGNLQDLSFFRNLIASEGATVSSVCRRRDHSLTKSAAVRDQSQLDYAHSLRRGTLATRTTTRGIFLVRDRPETLIENQRFVDSRGVPPSSRDVFPILLFLLPRGRGGRKNGRTWIRMFKRDTRIDRGELEGILHATDSAILSGNRRVLWESRRRRKNRSGRSVEGLGLDRRQRQIERDRDRERLIDREESERASERAGPMERLPWNAVPSSVLQAACPRRLRSLRLVIAALAPTPS